MGASVTSRARHRLTSSARICAVAALAAFVVAGCGGDETAGDADELRDALARAAQVSSEYGARYRMEGSVEVEGESVPMTGTAKAEAGGERDEVTVELADFEFTEFRSGPDVYTDVELFAGLESQLPPGTRWIKYDQDEVYDAIGFDGDLARELQNLDPARAVEVMHAVAEDIELVGRARVRGVATTRYTMVVPFRGLLDQIVDEDVLPDEATDELEDMEASWEVWIDDADRVRRIRIQIDFGDLSEMDMADMDLTSEVVSLERGLRVELPSGPDVYDATEDLLEEIDGRSAEELFDQ